MEKSKKRAFIKVFLFVVMFISGYLIIMNAGNIWKQARVIDNLNNTQNNTGQTNSSAVNNTNEINNSLPINITGNNTRITNISNSTNVSKVPVGGGGGGGGRGSSGGSTGGGTTSDTIYPVFVNYSDNNGNLTGSGIATFMVFVENSNGTVFLNFNNLNYTSTNQFDDLYNVSLNISSGNYSYYWFAWGNGTLNNYGQSSNRNYVVFGVPDLVSPSLTVISPLNQTYNVNNIVINFTAIDNIAVSSQWYNDGTSNISYTNVTNITVPQGINTFTFYANDTSGNINSSRLTFFADSIIPTISFANPTPNNNSYQNSNSFNVNFIGIEANLNFGWITMNNVNYTATSSETNPYLCNKSFSGLADGAYTYQAFVNDTAGNYNNTEKRVIFIDTIKPLIAVQYPQNISYTNAISSLNTSESDTNLKSCWYSLNSGSTNASFSCNVNITGLIANQGSNTWTVYSNDSAGNWNFTNVTFFVDSLEPQIGFSQETQNSGKIISSKNIIVNVTAFDTNLKNITINLYNQTSFMNSFSTNTSPAYINFSGLNDGIYYFNATAIDLLGNKNNTETRNVTIDTKGPSINVISPISNKYYNSNLVLINFSALDNSGISNLWFNNGTVNISYSNPVNISVIDGNHTFIFYANDTLGNINSTNVSFIVDTISPNIRIVSPINTTYGTGQVLINISTDGNNVWFNNGTSNISYTNPAYYNFSTGDYNLIAYANDSAGNLNSTNVSFIVDTTPPVENIMNPPNNTISNDSTQSFSVNVSDNDGLSNVTLYIFNSTGLFYKITTQLSGALQSIITVPITLADGSYVWNYRAFDLVSNQYITENRTLIIDTAPITPPLVIVYNPEDGSVYNSNSILINFTAISNRTIDKLWFNNGTNNLSYNIPVSINVSDGSYIFFFYANDTLGNINYTNISFSVNTTQSGVIEASRNFSANNYVAGSPIEVNITITPDSSTRNYIVDECLPSGWSATNINEGGVFNSSGCPFGGDLPSVSWPLVSGGPGLLANVFNYTAISPSNATGFQEFNGSVTYNTGSSVPIEGTTQISD